MRRQIPAWCPKEYVDPIIERWITSCSEVHGKCYRCTFEEDCTKLLDRLLARIYTQISDNQRRPSNSSRRENITAQTHEIALEDYGQTYSVPLIE